MNFDLRKSVCVEVTGDEVSITDTDISLSVVVSADEDSKVPFFNPTPAGAWSINSSGPYASDLAELMSHAGMLDEGLDIRAIRSRQRFFQLEQLLEALEEIPFYARQSAFGDFSLETEDDWSTLPLLRKADVRANFYEMIDSTIKLSSVATSPEYMLASTSGSTDERLQSLHGVEATTSPNGFEEIWTGEKTAAPSSWACFTTPRCSAQECHLGKSSFEERLRGDWLQLNSTEDLFEMSADLIRNIADELYRHTPRFVCANPVYLHWLGRRASELDIALPDVECVVTSYQFQSNFQKKAIERLFDAPVYSYYGATEAAAVLGQECLKSRMHVRPEHAHVEVLGANSPLQPGELGAFAITTLAARTMPLVRYLIGDVGRVFDEDCECVLNGCRIVEVHGRMKDLLFIDDNWVTTRQFDEAISDTPELDFYQCAQPSPNKLVVQAIPALGAEGIFRPGDVAERLRARLAVDEVEVHVRRGLDQVPGSRKLQLTRCEFRETPEFL